MSAGDFTPAQMRLQIEQAIQLLAPRMKTCPPEQDSRRQLLLTVDLLTSLWSDLQREEAASLIASRAETLRALLALCEMLGACEPDETPLALQATYRLVEGWKSFQPSVASPTVSVEEQAVVAEPAPAEEVEVAPVEELPPSQEEAAAPVEAVEPETEPLPPPPPVSTPPAQPALQEAHARLAEQMNFLEGMLDRLESHTLPREEAVPLLFAAACRYRLLQPEALKHGRDWDASQLKARIVALAKEGALHVWVPALAPNVELSEHELESLRTGYEALERSWQMWRWYQQHGSQLDKGTGAPLLESILAPVTMVWQIWSSKQLLNGLQKQDGTETLREAVREEASRRKWKLEMLSLNSNRQKQHQFIGEADEHWKGAKRQVEKKQQQSEAMDHVRQVLASPNPDTFEEDLLCALVACHQVQIPYSNKELGELLRGYHFLLENPAVPERCQLSGSEASAARRFLVNLGKHLLQREQKEAQQEQQLEEEPPVEQPNDLLRKAREITQGKKLFLLCFNRRAEAEQRIREELQFAEVDWPDLDGGESVNSLEAHIRNADMTIVVVRYSRTHWKEACNIARQYGKQFVMATKGYGVTHLAQQIVQQCGRC
ncbi:MAG: hypothetical protein RMM06_05450 [Armatimonadota bacterium]|nr:hypothetical protein [Armatimonadota bacterium]